MIAAYSDVWTFEKCVCVGVCQTPCLTCRALLLVLLLVSDSSTFTHTLVCNLFAFFVAGGADGQAAGWV